MKLSTLLIASATLLSALGSAHALPIAPDHTLGSGPSIVQVRGGCGFGAHRGPFGGCRLNRGPRGQMRRAITGAPRGCPPGLYRNRFGVCRR